MGFALTILYIVVTIISPEQFGPEWASYHVLIYLAGITALASLPNLSTFRYWRLSAQTFLLLGLVVAIVLSQLAHGYLGGAVDGLRTFLPSAAAFFFIVVNVTTARKLKIAALAVVASCVGLAVEALCGFYGGFKGDLFVLHNNLYSPQEDVIGQIMRIRGAGFLSDPNDFAQILLIALPLAFLAWRRGRVVTNFFVVLLPAALLLWTTYLTHSRGGLIALGAIALMTARKKLGTTTSAILAAVFILGLLALDFTGGRGISASDGADRLEAWANGLEMFKSAPVFGVGFSNFADIYDNITAHNSFVLCLAELGFVGSILWLALLVTTTIGLNRLIGGPRKRLFAREFFGLQRIFEMGYFNRAASLDNTIAFSEGTIALTDTHVLGDLPAMATADATESKTDLAQPATGEATGEATGAAAALAIVPRFWIVAIRLALVAFMTAAWFLSRSYTTTMYLVVGLATSAIALQHGDDKPTDRGHWIFSTVTLEFGMIFLIYCLVRLRH